MAKLVGGLLIDPRITSELRPGIEHGVMDLKKIVAIVTSVSVKSPADQMRMQRALEMAISAFEPRLENITVSLSPVRDVDYKLRFRIDARIKVEPAPEPVTFDTILQASTNQYVVKDA